MVKEKVHCIYSLKMSQLILHVGHEEKSSQFSVQMSYESAN